MGGYIANKHAVQGLMCVAALENALRDVETLSTRTPVNSRMVRSIEADFSLENPEETQRGFEVSIPLSPYEWLNSCYFWHQTIANTLLGSNT